MASTDASALLIAAPASGSGKTTVTLALLRAFRQQGIRIGSFKVGPDYIDPAFHALATGNPCFNLDPWAMRKKSQAAILGQVFKTSDLVIGEGVMGLFDGAQDGTGSTADVANEWNLPIVFVVDAKGQGASVGALLQGFSRFRSGVTLSGVIFNKVGGAGHIRLLKEAAASTGIPALGFIPKSAELLLDQRHLGLVQARETQKIEAFLNGAAKIIAEHCDLSAIREIATETSLTGAQFSSPILPLAQRIAIADDDAFAFTYPHILSGWRANGAELTFFSPLADEAPDPSAEAVFLPGGYPELYGGKLAAAVNFKAGMRAAAAKNKAIYGECGGFMTLGNSLTGHDGKSHEMLGLLPIETSFAEPKLHLGYRNARLIDDGILGTSNQCFAAHEFHYASITKTGNARALFNVSDARGQELGPVGATIGSVSGSFIHLIDGR